MPLPRDRPPPIVPAASGCDPLVAVAANMRKLGLSPRTPNPARAFEVVPLSTALSRAYATEACMVLYVTPGATRQPRINKTGLSMWTGETPLVHAVACDIDDMPDHAPWNDDAFDRAREQDRAWPIFATTGVYYTPAGRRVVQPLERALPVTEVEPYTRAWIAELRSVGLAADLACADWTRQFRLPHITRRSASGADWVVRSRCVDLSRMRAVELPTPARSATPADTRSARPMPRAGPIDAAPTAPIDDRWRAAIDLIARAVAGVQTEWHTLFLAISGALLRKGVPREQLASVVRAISLRTGADARTKDRADAARTTLERIHSGYAYTGFGTLRSKWPDVALAIDLAFESLATDGTTMREVGAAPAEPRALAPTAPATSADAGAPPAPAPPAVRSLAEITSAMEQAIERAPPGVTFIKAECGLGKSQAALRVMARRASKPYASPKALGVRAPPGSKSAMAVDKHSLALQCAADLAAAGIPTIRHFGPLSLKRDDGSSACTFHDVAGPLVAGGQRMQWELCERRNNGDKCPEYEGCRARLGFEGSTDARVAIGPHALVGTLDKHAGASGLLVIDEPQDFLESTTITRAQLDDAIDDAGKYFDGRFVAAVRPALYALRAFVDGAELGERVVAIDATTAVRAHGNAVPERAFEIARRSAEIGDDEDAVACACGAPFPPNFPPSSPPILQHSVVALLRYRDRASRIGQMSGVLRAVHHALASDYPVAVRVESHDERRRLIITAAREGLVDALRRDGPVIILDANADLHVPIISRIVGYDPPLHAFAAPDGAPIARTLIASARASRSAWKDGHAFAPTDDFVASVQRAFAWAAEDPDTRTLAIVTYAAIELALRYAAGVERESTRIAWLAAGYEARSLDAFEVALAPIVRRWTGPLLFAHYGATRGLNAMADADALVTLGDPWRNLGEVANDSAFLHLGEWKARYQALCRAELEQAHGRLRTIHRARPGRALHVGRIMPGGSGWTPDKVDVRIDEGGRPKQASHMSVDELADYIARAGGVRALARDLDVTHTTVGRWARGACGVPASAAERLRAALPSAPVGSRG